MIIKSASNEIAQLMLEKMNESSRCPTTPDKIAEALDHLTKAAQLFDTVGRRKCADKIDNLIAVIARVVKIRKQASDEMPNAVARVLNYARQSEKLVLKSLTDNGETYESAIVAEPELTEDGQEWTIYDSSGSSSTVLTYDDNRNLWYYQNGELDNNVPIKQEKAEAVAKRMFFRGGDQDYVDPDTGVGQESLDSGHPSDCICYDCELDNERNFQSSYD